MSEAGEVSKLMRYQYGQGRLWVHLNGRTIVIEEDSPLVGVSKRKKWDGGGAHQGLDVLAPMPGKVTKILVQTGQVVTKGQPVLVMEAMKMEYTLKSAHQGKVKAIHCHGGDQVSMSQVLVSFEEEKSV